MNANLLDIELSYDNPFLIFGVLIVGFIIVRMSIKKGKVHPKGGRYFKKKWD